MSQFFPLNYQDIYEININPEGTAVWARLASGLTGATQSNNDVVDQTPYLDGDGFSTSEVTGGQITIAFSGHREKGDPAQDYIDGIRSTLGSARKTQFRYRDSQGVGFDGECTIANVDVGGGDANAKKDFSFEIHINGKPTLQPLTLAGDLSITVAAGSVAGTTSFTATPGAENSLVYKLSVQSLGDQYLNQYLDGAINYNSGDNIMASVGQFLTAYEVDGYGRVVNYNSHELQAGDIA